MWHSSLKAIERVSWKEKRSENLGYNCEKDVMLLLDVLWDTWSSDIEGHPDVHFIGHGFTLDQPVLSQMVAVIRRENDVGFMKESHVLDSAEHSVNQVVHGQEGL